MKKIIIVALFITVLAAVSLSGCALPIGGETSPTPTVILGPVPSTLPTPTPIITPNPGIAKSKPSDDIRIITSPLDYKVVSDQKTRDGKQFENITLMLMNKGTQTAKNIVLIINIKDETTGMPLLYQEVRVGDIQRGGQEIYSILTDTHNPSNYIYLTIGVQWGENGEYYLTDPFKMTKTFMI